MRCIELESILTYLTEQILILAAVSHLEVMKLVYMSFINNSFLVFYILNEITQGLVLVRRMLNFQGIVFYISKL